MTFPGQPFTARFSAGAFGVLCGLVLLLSACGGGGAEPSPQPTTPPSATEPAPVPTLPVTFQALNQALDAQPPSADGQNSARSAAITTFDTRLWATDETQATPADIVDYYTVRMARVSAELALPVSKGFRVWAMYNHGFIVKTPTTTLAFDLVEGKAAWNGPAWSVKLPQALLDQIDVLMVSHEHGDHYDETERIPAAIKARGGAVLYPATGLARANTTLLMADRQTVQVRDLAITSYVGEHNVPTLIFEVVTAGGYKIVHTGDNGASTALPQLEGVHLLLLNGWVDGYSAPFSNVTGMKNVIDKLRPDVMIPGHFEELAHPKTDSAGRYRYTDALGLQDSRLVRSKTVVLTWGEHLEYTQPVCAAGLVRLYDACQVAGATPSDVVPSFLDLRAWFPDRDGAPDGPRGLARADQTLWVTRLPTDAGPGAVLRFDIPTGAYQGSFASPGRFPSQITHDGTDLWLVDYLEAAGVGEVKLVRLSTSGRALAQLPLVMSSPAHQLGGLAGDGNALFMAEWVDNRNTGEKGRRIVELDRSTGAVLRTVYSSDEGAIAGLALRGGSLWFTTPAGPDSVANLVNLSLEGAELSVRQATNSSTPGFYLGTGLAAGHDHFLSVGAGIYRFDHY